MDSGPTHHAEIPNKPKQAEGADTRRLTRILADMVAAALKQGTETKVKSQS
jgi:hypothetical protein